MLSGFTLPPYKQEALICRRRAEPLPQPRADVRVRLAGLRRRGRAPGADGPHRLVRHHERGHLIAAQPVEAALDLPIEHIHRLVALALLERFADADDGRQRRGDRGGHLSIDRDVGLAEERAALGVADDDVLGAGLLDHRPR